MTPVGRGAVCDACWTAREGGRVATRIVDADEAKCMFCGAPTRSGIVQRVHTDEVAFPEAVRT